MAKVELEKVSVVSVHTRGHGVTVKEADRTQGDRTFKGDRWALWFKEPTGLSLGDVISVTGFLGAKVGDPWKGDDGTERISVELSINSPKLDGFPAKGEPEPEWTDFVASDRIEPF